MLTLPDLRLSPTRSDRFAPNTLGVYLHWPYCARICPYCDFNVYAAKARDTAPLLDAMLDDLTAQRDLTGPRTITSVYFGGGTPSLMTDQQLGQVIERIGSLWSMAREIEITLEANPNDITADRAKRWSQVGINRLSIGVQSLDGDALRFLGRDHGPDEAVRAVDVSLGQFPSVSIDLIYARPHQRPEAWARELEAALSLGAQHVSLYELTIKPATPFGKRADRGELHPMPDDEQADLYDLTQTVMEARGYPAYEVSNHATGPAFWSQHNLNYWRCLDWLGIGPGAYGRLTRDGVRHATQAHTRPNDYIASVQAGGTGLELSERLTSVDWANEVLMMGLRSVEGIDPGEIEVVSGRRLDENAIDAFIGSGHLLANHDRLSLTQAGRLLADYIMSRLAI